MGESLGGLPDDKACYTDGKVDYEKLAERPYYKGGIKRLQKASRRGHNVALMCAESKPENCHRSKLIGQTLIAEGLEVLNIDEQSSIISQQYVMLRLTEATQKPDKQKT